MNVAEIVTNQVIEGLKRGKIPWHKPWISCEARNFASNHHYTGINPFLIALACEDNNWQHPLFASYKQITALGGKVNAGSKGTLVVFTKNIAVSDKKTDDSGEEIIEEKNIHVLRYYYVFNIAQTNLDSTKYVKANDNNVISTGEEFIKANNPVIITGPRACYSPIDDTITMPALSSFDDSNAYYCTAFHELTHWTGHATRLDRLVKTHFGDGEYSQEELVAEMGANMIAYHTGIPSNLDNSQAYINGWLSHLQNDAKFIIQASSKAEAAYNWLLKAIK